MITTPIWRDGDDLVVIIPAAELARLGLDAGDMAPLELEWLEPAPEHERSGSASRLLRQRLRINDAGTVATRLPDSPELPDFHEGDVLTATVSPLVTTGASG